MFTMFQNQHLYRSETGIGSINLLKQLLLPNNCFWNNKKKMHSSFMLINRTVPRKKKNLLCFSGRHHRAVNCLITSFAPTCSGVQEDCKPWQKLPLKFKGVCSSGSAQILEVLLPFIITSHNLLLLAYCFLLTTALASTFVFWGEPEQKSSSFQICFSSQWNLRSSKHDNHLPNPGQQCQPRLVCLVLGTTYRERKSDC